MASEVDIINLALSRLGDSATVSSISPPEGSAQAEHAARFYPIARNSLLELHSWGFATRRKPLAMLTSNSSVWDFAYATPAGMLAPLCVLPNDATDDAADTRPYIIESDDSGGRILYTDQADAILRYTALITDTTRFSPLFVDALSWLLASNLAGPLLKGDAGRNASMSCYSVFERLLGKATLIDANQRHLERDIKTPWMVDR